MSISLTPIEAAVRDIWTGVLGIAEIDPNSNFFEMGGNSLQCLKVLNRIRATFEIPIPLAAIFEAPTIAEQARIIVHSASRAADASSR
jgi:acyl carrier protein